MLQKVIGRAKVISSHTLASPLLLIVSVYREDNFSLDDEITAHLAKLQCRTFLPKPANAHMTLPVVAMTGICGGFDGASQ